MVQITKDDVLKIARLSHMSIYEEHVEKVRVQLQSILSYASRVSDYASQVTSDELDKEIRNSIVRPDVVMQSDSEPILAAAPEREGNYFVVPVIIEAGQ